MAENEIYIESKYGVADIIEPDMPLFRAAIECGRDFTIHIDSIKDFNSATIDIGNDGIRVDVTDVIAELITVVGDGMELAGITYDINDPAYDRMLNDACDACQSLYEETQSDIIHMPRGSSPEDVIACIDDLQGTAADLCERTYLLVRNAAASWMEMHRKEYGI